MLLLDIPAETYTWRPHRSAAQLMVCNNIPSLLGSRSIELSILCRSIKEQWDIHTQAICQLKIRSNIKLILCIETNLTCSKLWGPTRVTGYRNICRTETVLVQCIVVCNFTCFLINRLSISLSISKHFEIIKIIEIISTVIILNKEVLKLVVLSMSTESQSMIVHIPVQVICKAEDILVQRVCCRRTLCTETESTTAHILNLNHWCNTLRITMISYRHIRSLELVVYLFTERTVQFCSESISLRDKIKLIIRSIQIAGRTIAIQLLCINHAPSEGSLVLVVDVPVEFDTSLVTLSIILRVIV